ncbi:NAD(P)/FAD-dependent oxidoreductase [Nocardioides sp. GY 10127]|nr:NAD(P)/FAD-dependent oxidoreductase [Nocardioides sp. GY 10127]
MQDDPHTPDSHEVDVVVLGVGSGGERLAHRLREGGLEVAVVESGLVGGECPFHGCTPSKLLIRSADVLAEARRVEGLAGSVRLEPSLAPAAARIREANHDWDDEAHAGPLVEAGALLVRGHGRLDGPGRVQVATEAGTVLLVARRGVVLDTGTDPAVPPVEGLAGTPFWTNREAAALTEAPRSLAVLGGGPIGTELAQALARFGTRVTLVEDGERLLGPEEPEAAALVTDVLREEGVDVRTSTTLARVAHAHGRFDLTLEGPAGAEDLEVERLLVATGRAPRLRRIGLATVGLDPDADVVDTDERCRAGERLWAIGDVTGKGAFTSVALYQADVVARDLLDTGTDREETGPEAWADYRAVARVTFTDPEVGAVGLTEAQAREHGLDVAVGLADVGRAPRGWMHGARGLVKVVADRRAGVLVGATTVAPYGGEVIGLLSTAVHARVPVRTLRRMHLAYPTFHGTIGVALDKLAEQGV